MLNETPRAKDNSTCLGFISIPSFIYLFIYVKFFSLDLKYNSQSAIAPACHLSHEKPLCDTTCSAAGSGVLQCNLPGSEHIP
uniref:Uncharacterized protein n=1 Tax=Anguilla anguilla TaxID=7936 RepID=A0A0E9X4K5_ANGAN